jgi:hypothetical protein
VEESGVTEFITNLQWAFGGGLVIYVLIWLVVIFGD